MPQKPKPLDETRSVRDWWGKELRNWRQVRGLSTRLLGDKVHVSGTTIERIEKNERPCDTALATRLDEALQAGGALVRLWRLVEADADKRPPTPDTAPPASRHADDARPERNDLPVDRRALLAAGGVAALRPTSLLDLLPQPNHAPAPAQVRPEDIEQVLTAATTLSGWDHAYGGGGLVRSSLLGQLTWARGLLQADCPSALEHNLFTAVGRLAVVMGASAFDAYEHQDAARLLHFGQQCAEHAGNWHLRATALNWLARQAIWCGRPDDGLTHAENGLVRADRLTHREQAMLHNARARALAKMGNAKETLRAIGQSDAIFSHARPGEDVPWMAYYDNAQHHGDTGHAAFDIALLPGQSSTLARQRLQTAVDQHTDAYRRSRAISSTKLATLIMATGDPAHAVDMAHRALDGVGRLRSRRAIDDLKALSRAARPYSRDSDVAALQERIALVVAA